MEAVNLDPSNFWSYVERQGTYRELKDWDRAVEDATTCIKLRPNYHLGYAYRGWNYCEHARTELALADYTRAIDLQRRDTSLFNDRSWIFQALERWDNAPGGPR